MTDTPEALCARLSYEGSYRQAPVMDEAAAMIRALVKERDAATQNERERCAAKCRAMTGPPGFSIKEQLFYLRGSVDCARAIEKGES